MNLIHYARRLPRSATVVLMLLAGGCAALSPSTTPQPSFYSLDGARSATPAAPGAPGTLSQTAPTLIVNSTHAATGFDSQRIIYVREPNKLEYYAHSEWIGPPARMLAPLIVAAVENNRAFRAVVVTPSAAAGDLRLDTEIVRLQHEFTQQPSRVRFTLRAYMVDNLTRRVVAWREFDEAVNAASEDPKGGVAAANRSVQVVLEQLARFCADAAADWQATMAKRGEKTAPPAR
jgi:cholesterol transport system auxiliary component